MLTVAALYVEAEGTYFGLPGVEPWALPRGEARIITAPIRWWRTPHANAGAATSVARPGSPTSISWGTMGAGSLMPYGRCVPGEGFWSIRPRAGLTATMD